MADGTWGTSDSSWDAEKHEAALAHLESLQDQITALRATIPSLVRPLTRPDTTKSEAFNALKKAAISATTDVRSFRTQWGSQQTQQILSKSTESRAKNADLSSGKDIPVYGWTKGTSDTPTEHAIKEEKAA